MAGYLKDFLTNIGVATTIGGPAFMAWNYIKSRTYAVKLELFVDGEILHANDGVFLKIRASVKNIGNSRVALKETISYFRVCTVENTNPSAAFLEPVYLMSIPCFRARLHLRREKRLRMINLPTSNTPIFWPCTSSSG